MPKIYIGCCLTHASDEFKLEVAELKKLLRPKYEIMEFLGVADGEPEDVYRHDIGQVKTCDLLLAECSQPSTGLGFEIATALHYKKPVLAVAKTEAKVSRLILGITSTLFSFIRYNSLEEIADGIEKKLAGII